MCAVVVTYKRAALLAGCLRAVQEQTRPPDHVVVVDNASTDGTAEMVEADFPAVELLRMERNEGGAGGFAAGLERGAQTGAAWLWVMDDDTHPAGDALERLLDGASAAAPVEPALLASRVVWRDGELHPMNVPVPRELTARELLRLERAGVLRGGLVPIRMASFVSVAISREAVEAHGLPRREFFTWADDTEYTARVLRARHGFWVVSSVAHHRTETAYEPWETSSDRFYYAVRNRLLMMRGDALGRRDKLEMLRVTGREARHYLRFNGWSPRAAAVVARGALHGALGVGGRR